MGLAEDITAIVGPNAAGKTALLQALAKLFGVSRAQRTIHRSDFHLAPNADPDNRDPRELYIDVLISLAELSKGSATSETVAPSFRHMRIERAGQTPVCRLRLEARWEDDGTVEGEVSQELFWVDTLAIKPNERFPLMRKSILSLPLIGGLSSFTIPPQVVTPAHRSARQLGRWLRGCCGRSNGRAKQ